MIGVLFPSQYEANEFVKQLNNCMRYRMERGFPCYIGELNKKTLSVGIIGMGQPHAARRATLFIDKVKPKSLYLAGFAGGLNPELALGAVRMYRGADGIHTTDEIIPSAERKKRLLEHTGCDIVDMESRYIAEEAKQRGLELTIVRAVSDSAEEVVPVRLLSYGYDQKKGRETPLRMAIHLATHWGDISRLRKFLAPMPKVRTALTEALVAQIQQDSGQAGKAVATPE